MSDVPCALEVPCPICFVGIGRACLLWVNGERATHETRCDAALAAQVRLAADSGPAIDEDAWTACQRLAETPGGVKPRPTLLPAVSLLAVAQLITEQQATRGDGWLDVPAEDHLDAAQRHLLKHQAGELLDESGHPHEVHAAARLLMAIAVRQRASTTNERRNTA